MSTRQMDNNSQQLPQLRDTAKKYSRWSGRPQQDFQINTSAIGRAFPDFSQGGSSDESMSIEVGRGAKTRQRTPSRMPRAEYSDNIDSPVVRIGDFEILSTPPGRQQSRTPKQRDASQGSLRKDMQSKRVVTAQKENVPPPHNTTSVKGTDYVSGASRTTSGAQRRTLAELHAKVSDDTEGSLLGERPSPIEFVPRATRFTGGQARNPAPTSPDSSKKKQATAALADAIANQRNQTPSKAQVTESTTPNPTQQSFLLPNMPDISELVSGTFKDGTPVFSRSGKAPSRFSSGSSQRTLVTKQSHVPIDGIPVPEEEKAIFLSLQLLQDRVATLELEKTESQRLANELQKTNYELEAENKALHTRHRADSALGDSGSDAEHGRGDQKLAADKFSK